MTNGPGNAIAANEQASIDAFERAWQDGQTPQIRQFLPPTPSGQSNASSPTPTLLELVLVDLWHRWRRASGSAGPAALGAAPSDVALKHCTDDLPSRPLLEDYVRALPELGALRELPLDAVAEEYRARLRWCSGATDADYIARFPAYAMELPARLAAIRDEVHGHWRSADPWTVDFTGQRTPVAASAAAPASPAAPSAPQCIGKYQIIGALDEGGQARVYRAVHPDLAKELVIKLGRNPIQAGQVVQDRLIAESRILADLDDPAIARVFDAGLHEGLPYVAMEYVRGPHLRQYFEQHRPSARQSAAIIARCARGLSKAHAWGITHQDLKPKNIVIDETGQPRILDFGLATFRHAWNESTAEPGTISGTPEYMPPEQAAGLTSLIGPRSDVFALGGVLYFLLVGHAPFQGKDVLDALAKARACDFDSAALHQRDIPAALARVCLRAMQAEPQARYQTAEAMADDLECFLARPRRIRRAVLAAGGGMLLLAVAALAWMLYPLGDAAAKADVSKRARQVLGRPLSQEFAVDFQLLGQDGNSPTEVKLVDGQRVVCRVTPDRDCYLGIWHLDGRGKATQLFPNRYESDDRLRAGIARTIPGDLKYAAKAKLSQGAQYLYIVASTEPGRNRLSPLEKPYDVTIEGDTSPLVSETFLPVRVVPKP
jgi:tRNA A-37 threonylcarbamoyl transferase component Bud32